MSTNTDDVACPPIMMPGDTVHLKVSFTESPPDTFAMKFRIVLILESGQETVTTGQLWEYARSARGEITKSNKSMRM
jgi:hypothetical protein